MNNYFAVNDKVYDIVEKYPETIDVFQSHGFSQLTDEKVRKTLGKTISLEMALRSKRVNVELFVEKLLDVIEENRVAVDGSFGLKDGQEADIKIEGILPCPVRLPLLEVIDKWVEEESKKQGISLQYELKAASSGVDWLNNSIKNAESEEEISDLYISAGFDLFFDNRLMGKFKAQGVFEDITNFEKLNGDFENDYMEIRDPDGDYTIIAGVPAVFLINTEELKGRKIPTTWKDILREEYQGALSLPVGDFDLFNAILLNIYKNYGEEGVKRLGKSLSKGMHPSEMLKSHRRFERPAITVMPYFFSKMAQAGGPMKAIWPEDGAILSPIFLLSKRSKKDKLKPIVDLFASKELGEILSHNGRFPSANPGVDNRISKENKYMWLGWDYIKENNIGELIEKCENIFNEIE